MTAMDSQQATPLYASPTSSSRPLRVALVAPACVPNWIHRFKEIASEYPWIEVIHVAIPSSNLPQVENVPLLVRAAVGLESALLGKEHSLEPILLPSDPDPDGHPGAQQPSIVQQVEALRPDLVVLLGPPALGIELSAVAPKGCWTIDSQLVDKRHAGLALLSPMLRHDFTTRMGMILSDRSGKRIELAVSTGQTRAGSFLRQREAAFRKLPGLLVRGLRRVAEGEALTEPRSTSVLQLAEQPDAGHMPGARALALLARAAIRRLSGRRRDGSLGWTLVLRLAGSPLDPSDPVIGSYALLRPQIGWWADPFILNADGHKLIFVEEMEDPKRNNANIACVELANGGAKRLGVSLDEPGHLSYPQVFPWEDNWYMTVESSYDRRVSLYRATRFPLEWTRIKNLITGRVCVDPTLHFHEGFWYLFTNVSENAISTSDELFLFVSDRLDGDYVPHPASPLVCDVRRARMAGKLFLHRGRLIRPAQDCGPCYGSAVVFNEVLQLSPTAYSERPLSKLEPNFARRIAGCHTYNADGQVEVLDVFGRPPGGTAYLKVTGAAMDRGPKDEVEHQHSTPLSATQLLTGDGLVPSGASRPAYGCGQSSIHGPQA